MNLNASLPFTLKVIEHRLVSSDLPLQMRNLRIVNGFVTFIVNNEFEAMLTLTGDSPSVPWRLLKLNILVKDKETGEGKPLVHPLQVSWFFIQGDSGTKCFFSRLDFWNNLFSTGLWRALIPFRTCTKLFTLFVNPFNSKLFIIRL